MNNYFMLIHKYFKIFLLVFFLLPQSSLASQAIDNLVIVGDRTGLKTNSTPSDVVVRIINSLLGLVGSIFIILIIWAGFNWMTSAGNTDKIKKAKETILNSVIGLGVIIASYIITYFIVNTFVNGSFGQGGGMGGTP